MVGASGGELGRLEKELGGLRQRARQLNTPDTFAQSAKLSRKAKKLEKEIKSLKARETAKANRLAKAVTISKWVLTLCITVFYWGRPLLALEERQCWPLQRSLRWPDLRADEDGAAGCRVSAFAFCLLVNNVINILWNA
mmetsp:Transcript_2429/g.6126  ORF Transcript_2429/g.6126 Transcript_2429/m.6126 type:complete len:139 (-) Transcript_2429:79-495(-)